MCRPNVPLFLLELGSLSCPHVYRVTLAELTLRFCRRLFLDPVVSLSIFILMGCDVAYMGAFLCMPIFLTEAAGLSITDAAQILALRPAFGSVISLIMAKLMGEKKQAGPDLPGGQRPGCCSRCTVSNLNLTLAGCCVSVIGCKPHAAKCSRHILGGH